METKRYRSKDPEHKWIMVRKVTRRDIPQYMRNLQEVASEGVFLGTEKVTPGHRKGTLDHMKESKSLTCVAMVDGKIVGSLTMWWSGLQKMAHVRELGMLVIDEYREMGVGSALMDYGLRWAREKKIEKVTLGVFSPNKRAYGLYKKFGFKVEGVLKNQHVLKGKRADEYRMALFL